MSSVSQLWNRCHQAGVRNEQQAAGNAWRRIRVYLEYIWIGVTFLLFIFLGPFAAIAVVPAVFSLALQNDDGAEPTRAATAGESR